MLNLLGYSDEDEPEWDIEPRSSSVEELGFYCCELDFEIVAKLIRACRRLRRCVSDTGDSLLWALLAEEFGDCIEEPIVQLSDPSAVDPLTLAKFKSLRVLQGPTLDSLLLPQRNEDPRKADKVRRFQDFVAPTIERIEVPASSELTTRDEVQDALFRATLDIASDERYSALKVVCLFHAFGGSSPNDSPMFERHEATIRLIEQNGVSVHHRNRDGKFLTREEHDLLHDGHSFESGTLTEIETDPRPVGERY